LPVPGHLSRERGAVTGRRLAVAGITFDFGNTLVRVDGAGLQSVVETTASALADRGEISDRAAFVAAWGIERDRQFRLQVPQLLEVDLAERIRHVLAALRGSGVPATDDEAWDEPAAEALVDSDEVAFAVEVYSESFVAEMTPLPDAEPTLRTASEAGFRLGILSNWPLARTIDRYVEAHGWKELLPVVVVSQRVGVIKPHPEIFALAAEAMNLAPERLLHVGDDWAADVVGASDAGWRVAYLRNRQGDTPLPTSNRDSTVVPDLELGSLADLLPHLDRPARS
jgi:HAD superfamily hydrolase (TIGR01509 family)